MKTESFRGRVEQKARAQALRALGYHVREWENMDLYAAASRFRVSFWRAGSI